MFGNAFKQRAHYVFNYKPRYYDERKERLENLKKKYETKNIDSEDIPKISLSKDNLRSDWQRHKKSVANKNVNRRLAIIIAVLVGILAYLFELHKLF
ncbi:MAG: hypothetical protein DRI95_12825 [Bacteroidetes bacterium]|nr:MAG: hypothetical protein DRI95_12825 [Bacteroidota bacterium]